MPSPQKKSGTTMRLSSSAKQEPLMGSTVLGERGQVVIPKDVRDRLRLKAGDKLMVIVHKRGPIMLVPVEHMQQIIRQMSDQMSTLLDQTK